MHLSEFVFKKVGIYYIFIGLLIFSWQLFDMHKICLKCLFMAVTLIALNEVYNHNDAFSCKCFESVAL